MNLTWLLLNQDNRARPWGGWGMDNTLCMELLQCLTFFACKSYWHLSRWLFNGFCISIVNCMFNQVGMAQVIVILGEYISCFNKRLWICAHSTLLLPFALCSYKPFRGSGSGEVWTWMFAFLVIDCLWNLAWHLDMCTLPSGSVLSLRVTCLMGSHYQFHLGFHALLWHVPPNRFHLPRHWVLPNYNRLIVRVKYAHWDSSGVCCTYYHWS